MKKVLINDEIVDDFIQWIGEDGLRWFKHLKGLTGTYSPVLKLNEKRKGIPVHPVHFREGMQIRNWMRKHDNCSGWIEFDSVWVLLVEEAVKKYETL